jgi:hypothetical protein
MGGAAAARAGAPVALACLLLAAAGGCSGHSGDAAAARQGDGTRRMQQRIEDILRGIDPMENGFMNAGRAAALRPRLAGAIDPHEYLEMQPQLAIELLNAGRTEEAIAEFDRLRAFLSQPGIEVGVRPRYYLERNRAVAYLRLGEQENCILNHSAASCLLPIRKEGVHQRQRGSRAAIEVLDDILRHVPDELEARWFLNIAHMTLGEYPDKVPPRFLIPPQVFKSGYDIGRFPDVATALGIDVEDNAGGGIVDDLDNDGDLDIMVSTQAFRGPLRAFRNNGDGTFTQMTEAAGLTGVWGGLNLVSTDYDNDGDVDALLLRGGWMMEAGRFPNSLLRNNGDWTFDDVTEEAGLLSFHPTQTAAWLDYDHDGRLDLYIGNETNNQAVHPSELFRNNGDGTFTECAARAGVDATGVIKGVTAGDFNNDGRPDLYLSRRGKTNILYRNDGPRPGGDGRCDWVFTDVTAEAGVGEPIDSFPTWFFDYDNDGWEDLFCSGYEFNGPRDVVADYLGLDSVAARPRLFRNNGDGRTFTDVTRQTGLWRVLHAMGAQYGDLDNDGWLDFYLGTGDPNLGTLIPNRLFRNDGGRRFQDVTTSAGVGHLQKGHGISFADLDHDGDQDIHEVMGGAYEGDRYRNVLFENPGHGNHWLKIRLEGVQSNRPGLGARIKVVLDTPEGERVLHRSVATGASFGNNPFRQEIGLGRARRIVAVVVTWPRSGTVQTFRGLEMDRAYRIREGDDDAAVVPLPPFRFAAGAPRGHEGHHPPASR